MNDLPADVTTTATIALDGVVFTDQIETFDDVDWVRITGISGGDNIQLETFTPDSQDPDFYIPPIISIIAVDSSGTQYDLGFIDERSPFYVEDFGEGTVYYLSVGDGDTLDTGDYEIALSISADEFVANVNTTGRINVNGITEGVHETDLDQDWFRLDLEPNTSYQITSQGPQRLSFFDANGDRFDNVSSVFDPATGTRTYVIEVSADETIFVGSTFAFGNGFPLPSPYTISVDAITTAEDDHSDNFTPEEATPLDIGQTVSGVITSIGDGDVFYTEFINGVEYQFTVGADVTLELFDSTGTTVFNSGTFDIEIDAETGDRIITFAPFNPGNYFVRILNTDNTAPFPIEYSITSSSAPIAAAALDDSDSTFEQPDNLIIGEVLAGQGNFGQFPDFDYYSFEVDAGTSLFFDTIIVRDDGFFDYFILDSSGNIIEPNFDPFIVDPFIDFELTARIYQFEEEGVFTLVTRAGTNQTGPTITPIDFTILSTSIPNFTVPAALTDLYGPDIALWFPTLDVGETPTESDIFVSDILGRRTDPDTFDIIENLEFVIAEGETAFANGSSVVFSEAEDAFVVNNGTLWSNSNVGVGGSNIGFVENNGAFVVLGEFSAIGGNFTGSASLHNNGDIFVFAPQGASDGFQISSSFDLFGGGENFNTGQIIVQNLTGQARAFFSLNENNFNNSGNIVVDGFTNALAIVMDGDVTNSGTITSTVGSLARNSIGVTYRDFSVDVINSGTITADISILTGQFSDIENSGVLNGDVIFDSFSSVPNDSGFTTDLFNSGVINGDVIFDEDVSVYNGSTGRTNGEIFLGAADDTAEGGAFRDVIFGGSGNDTIAGNNGNDLLNGGAGNDDIRAGNDNDVVNGDAGNDALFGQNGADSLNGGEGDDNINGGAGNDTILGEQGIDTLIGGAGIDILNGGDGDDSLLGGDAADTLFGGIGADTLNGGGGNDTLNGGDDNDSLIGGFGVDNLFGQDGDDNLLGGNSGDALFGGNGNDSLNGGGGNDDVNGGAGNDIILGGLGIDTVNGGAGNDDISGGNGADSLSGAIGEDLIHGGGGDDTIFGNGDDDMLFGDTGLDTLYGGTGNDILEGGTGADTLHGDAGNDNLSGQGGNDMLFGGAGNDILDGGRGSDILNGGVGADQFIFATGSGIDTVEDFDAGVDVIDLSDNVLAESFADVIAVAFQDGNDIRIELNENNILTLENFDLNDLDVADFLF